MAATNETFDGGSVLMYVGGVAVAYQTSASISITHAPREIKNKTDGRWPKRKQGTFDASGTLNCLYALLGAAGAAIYNLQDALGDMLAGTSVTLEYSNANTGDYKFTGAAQVTGVNLTFGAHGETVEGDMSWSADGAWDLSAI